MSNIIVGHFEDVQMTVILIFSGVTQVGFGLLHIEVLNLPGEVHVLQRCYVVWVKFYIRFVPRCAGAAVPRISRRCIPRHLWKQAPKQVYGMLSVMRLKLSLKVALSCA